jgi:hypothetical protein
MTASKDDTAPAMEMTDRKQKLTRRETKRWKRREEDEEGGSAPAKRAMAAKWYGQEQSTFRACSLPTYFSDPLRRIKGPCLNCLSNSALHLVGHRMASADRDVLLMMLRRRTPLTSHFTPSSNLGRIGGVRPLQPVSSTTIASLAIRCNRRDSGDGPGRRIRIQRVMVILLRGKWIPS